GRLRRLRAEVDPEGAAAGPDQGQAGDFQGTVPAEGLAELDNGPGRDRRPGFAVPEVMQYPGPPHGWVARVHVLRAVGACMDRQPSKTAGAVGAHRRRAWMLAMAGNRRRCSGVA